MAREGERRWGARECFLTLGGIVLGVLCILAGTSVVLRRMKHHYLFQPNTPNRFLCHNPVGEQRPGDCGLPFYSVIFVTMDQVALHGWFIPQLGTDSRDLPTLIYYHGNSGNMGRHVKKLAKLYHTLGVNIFTFDYRGYGESEGVPSEAGLEEDSHAAVRWLVSRGHLERKGAILYGFSLGGAVAIAEASDRLFSGDTRDIDMEELQKLSRETEELPRGKFGGRSGYIRALVVENSFASLKHMVSSVVPAFEGMEDKLSLLTPLGFNSMAAIRHVHVPTLIMAGEQDETVNPVHGEALFRHCASAKKDLLMIPSADHANPHTKPEWAPALTNFMESAFATNSTADSWSPAPVAHRFRFLRYGPQHQKTAGGILEPQVDASPDK